MEGFKQYALLLTIMIPFVAAVAVAFFPSGQKRAIRLFMGGVALVTLALSIYIMAAYKWGDGGYQMVKSFQWLDYPFNIGFAWGVDGISAPMVLLTGIVFFTGVIVSWNIEHRPKDFFVLYGLMVAGVYGVFVSTDLFFLFFYYELAVIPMYLLIGVWGSTTDFKTFLRTKEYGAMKLTLYLVAGSVLIWVGIFALFAVSSGAANPTFSIEGLRQVMIAEKVSHTFQLVIFPLFMIGFGVLAGMWPFHTWSPDGHVAAPTAVSMVHAGVLMKLGAYGIIRVGLTILPEGAKAWAPVLIGLGSVNVLYGAISAMGQRDLKYMIGYSSVSHMGIVLVGVATLNVLGVSGAVLQMFSHGVMTALLFTVVGAIYDRAHIRDMTVLKGLAKRMNVIAVFWVIVGLTSLGLPGLSGFVAEFLVFLGVFRSYPPLAIIGVVAAAITAVYILRMLAMTFFGPPDPKWEHLHDGSRREIVAASILTTAIIVVGLYPAVLMRVINTGVTALLAGMGVSS